METFVLNSRYSDLAAGGKKLGRAPFPWVELIVTVGILAMLAAAYLGGKESFDFAAVRLSPRTFKATVLHKDYDVAEDLHRVRYTYELNGSWTGRGSVDPELFGSIKVGGPVEIEVSSWDSSKSLLVGQVSQSWGSLFFIWAMLLGCLAFWVGFGMMLAHDGRRRRKCLSKGRLLPAVATLSGSSTEAGYVVHATYRFESPGTKEMLSGVEWHGRPDLVETELGGEYDTKVLYVDDQTFMML